MSKELKASDSSSQLFEAEAEPPLTEKKLANVKAKKWRSFRCPYFAKNDEVCNIKINYKSNI